MSLGGGLPLPAGTVGRVIHANNLAVLPMLPDESVDLIYIDPPFNTGKAQTHTRLRAVRSAAATRVGFGGETYETTSISRRSFADQFDDYLTFLQPRFAHARRVLKQTGSMYVHIDWREVHYVKLLLDEIFGRRCFINEIIWAYDFGGRGKGRWPCKHDNILLYARDSERYFFDLNQTDRLPYMAPGLVGKEKAAVGKTPTDVWWQTIVPTNGSERLGYPTQKPLAILRRIVAVSSPPNGVVLDFFAGSGTTGQACLELARPFVLIDENPEAIAVMQQRFAGREIDFITMQ